MCNTPIGTDGFGNHKHNDQLAVEWSIDNQPLVVDPGTYTYTQDPAARNLFRSTRSHTTVMVDGEEQHELRPELLFRLFPRGEGSLRGSSAGVIGSHSSYERLGVSHRRRVTALGQGCLVMDDFFNGSESHLLEWAFSIHPEVNAEVETGRAVLTGPRGGGSIVTNDLIFAIRESWYSPGYGQKLRSRQLHAARRDGPSRVTCVLVPLGTDMEPGLAKLTADGLWEGR
jgi:uncharacterized heparinase superfamily protein